MITIVDEFLILHTEIRGLMDKIDRTSPQDIQYDRYLKIAVNDINTLLGMIPKVKGQIDTQFLDGVRDGLLYTLDVYRTKIGGRR